jgi:CheY-like chemotaxis protein
LRVLVVEDEALVSMLLEDTLIEIGCQSVSIVASLPEAMDKAASLAFDAVVLDVNLNGQQTFAVAELLVEKRIPFVFSTGYGAAGIPDHLNNVPVLQKPFQERELEQALSAALAARVA